MYRSQAGPRRSNHQAMQLREIYGLGTNLERFRELPGIGRSTAGAIIALGSRRHAVILDGNVKRVLCRVHCVEGSPDQPKVQQKLWQLAASHTPEVRCADYTQAIMDLGATVCTRVRPACESCRARSASLAS